MTPRDRDLLAIRYIEIEAEVAEIQAGRVVVFDDPGRGKWRGSRGRLGSVVLIRQ